MRLIDATHQEQHNFYPMLILKLKVAPLFLLPKSCLNMFYYDEFNRKSKTIIIRRLDAVII